MNKYRAYMFQNGYSNERLKRREFTASDFSSWPIQSPFENTKHIYLGLQKIMPTKLYHLTERIGCDFRPGDVFLGHPIFPYYSGGRGVTELSYLKRARASHFCLITPLHCNVSVSTNHINECYLSHIDSMIDGIDCIYGIMGPYWWDRWNTSPYAHWKRKMVRVDMAVDPIRYPRVKTRYNKPGSRGFLYIGANEPQKGTKLLETLMGRIGNCRRGWVGSGPEIPNVPRISPRRPLTPDFIRELARDYDFFINTSIADANPTTILESMAWGFPVVSTPESGYYEESYRKLIYWDDIENSVRVLEEMQYMSETKLEQMANEARSVVCSNYTWDIFVKKISLGMQSSA